MDSRHKADVTKGCLRLCTQDSLNSDISWHSKICSLSSTETGLTQGIHQGPQAAGGNKTTLLFWPLLQARKAKYSMSCCWLAMPTQVKAPTSPFPWQQGNSKPGLTNGQNPVTFRIRAKQYLKCVEAEESKLFGLHYTQAAEAPAYNCCHDSGLICADACAVFPPPPPINRGFNCSDLFEKVKCLLEVPGEKSSRRVKEWKREREFLKGQGERAERGNSEQRGKLNKERLSLGRGRGREREKHSYWVMK